MRAAASRRAVASSARSRLRAERRPSWSRAARRRFVVVRMFVQDFPILVTTHSRVQFLEFHADDEVPVQSRPIMLGLQLADLI